MSLRTVPKRYQLNKHGARIVKTRHPWVFRSQLSSAISVYPEGQWLELVDGSNQTIGYGIYCTEGLVGIRVFSPDIGIPSASSLRKHLLDRISKREHLRKYTDSFRLLHGENDGIPGVVLDCYGGEVLTVQAYTPGVETLARYLGSVAAETLGIKTILWKTPRRRRGGRGSGNRVLRGQPPEVVTLHEGKMEFFAAVQEGQKSGAFLDLRALRKWIGSRNWGGKRVLNLFSYTGTLGYAAVLRGAKDVRHYDMSQGALDLAKKFHGRPGNQFIKADVFHWVRTLDVSEKFDLVICDPPSMASESGQVGRALKSYDGIYRTLVKTVGRGGYLVGACCTSRISREQFRKTVDRAVGGRLRFVESLHPEDDHPVSFPEGDYLKILIYQAPK